MECIAELVDNIFEELEGAENYAKLAIKYKDKDRQLAETYIQMAKEELNHMNRLHEQVTQKISDYRNANGELPEIMSKLYDYEHNKIVQRTAQAQAIMGIYK